MPLIEEAKHKCFQNMYVAVSSSHVHFTGKMVWHLMFA